MKIAKATIAVSPITFSNIVTGVIRSKFTAVMLGTQGVGLFSQAFNFFTFFISLASLGMRLGITKYIAKYSSEKNDEKVTATLAQSISMQLAVSAVAIILIAIFAKTFSLYLFASDSYAFLLILLSFGIPFVALSGTFESILLGFGDYKEFAKGRVIVNVLSLVPLFVFVWAMKIRGAFIYIVASAVLGYAVFYYLVYKKVPRAVVKGMFSMRLSSAVTHDDRALGIKLLSYGGTSFITGAVGLLCVVLSRTLLINYLGLEANGLYQVVFAISSYYLALFTNGLWSYYYPRVSAAHEPEAFNYETNQALRFCLLGVMPFVLCLYLFRFVIIHLLFSSKFLASAELFSYQLFGDIFFLLFYILGSSLLAKERLKSYIAFTVGYGICYIGLFIVLCRYIGLRAMPCAYLISSFLGVVLLAAYHVKHLKVDISTRNIVLFSATIALVSVIFYLHSADPVIMACKAILVVLFFWLLVTKEEKAKAVAFVSGIVRR